MDCHLHGNRHHSSSVDTGYGCFLESGLRPTAVALLPDLPGNQRVGVDIQHPSTETILMDS